MFSELAELQAEERPNMAYEVGTNGTWVFVCDLAPEDTEYDSRHTGCQFPYVNKVSAGIFQLAPAPNSVLS